MLAEILKQILARLELKTATSKLLFTSRSQCVYIYTHRKTRVSFRKCIQDARQDDAAVSSQGRNARFAALAARAHISRALSSSMCPPHARATILLGAKAKKTPGIPRMLSR